MCFKPSREFSSGGEEGQVSGGGRLPAGKIILKRCAGKGRWRQPVCGNGSHAKPAICLRGVPEFFHPLPFIAGPHLPCLREGR